jgi:hypothetical protein
LHEGFVEVQGPAGSASVAGSEHAVPPPAPDDVVLVTLLDDDEATDEDHDDDEEDAVATAVVPLPPSPDEVVAEPLDEEETVDGAPPLAPLPVAPLAPAPPGPVPPPMTSGLHAPSAAREEVRRRANGCREKKRMCPPSGVDGESLRRARAGAAYWHLKATAAYGHIPPGCTSTVTLAAPGFAATVRTGAHGAEVTQPFVAVAV